MVIKKLAQLCRSRGAIILCDREDGMQWAGVGTALYALAGLPTLALGSLCAVMDIPPEKAAEMITRHEGFPPEYEPKEYASGRALFFDIENRIRYQGAELLPCGDGERLFFINPTYLKPLDDCENLGLYAENAGGKPYIVAYEGMFPVAVLAPEKAGQNLLDWMESSSKLARETEREYQWA